MLKTCSFWIVISLSLSFYCYEFFLRISPGLILGTLIHYQHLGNYNLSDYHIALSSLLIALFCATAVTAFIPQNRHRT